MKTPAEPPIDGVENVLLLSADSLRADRVHDSRNGVPLTPNIDQLAAEAIEFESGIAPGPSTRDSMPSIHTGALPSAFEEYGLPEPGTPPPTLAEHLSQNGFSTAGFSQNNFTSRRYNIDRGFDHYDDVSVESRKETSGVAWRLPIRNAIEGTPLMDLAERTNDIVMEKLGVSLFHRSEGGDELTDRALEWFSGTDGKRFLWLHYMDTHHPYRAPSEIQQRFGQELSPSEVKRLGQKARNSGADVTDEDVSKLEYIYDCSVRFVDEQIGRLVDHLRHRGSLSDSMIIVTADHGEEFGEHGKYGHAAELWDTLLRVPLIVYHPSLGSTTVEGQASLRLLVDTVVEGSGLFELPDEGADYVSAEVLEFRGGKRCSRGRTYKLIEAEDDTVATRIDGDREREIPIEEMPEGVRRELEARLDIDPETIGVSVDVDEDQFREDLAALGYLDE